MLPLLLSVLAQQSLILVPGHAHNDYEHARPLLDALENGFVSVEADVFLVEGELRVGHSRAQLKPGRTLKSLYLDPLLSRVKANNGSVYNRKAELLLLVDIKSDGSAVYAELVRELEPCASMLTRIVESKVVPGAVRVVISGDRPASARDESASPYVFVDGRIADLSSTPNNPHVSLISDDFSSVFSWKGEGDFPVADMQKVRDWTDTAHRAA